MITSVNFLEYWLYSNIILFFIYLFASLFDDKLGKYLQVVFTLSMILLSCGFMIYFILDYALNLNTWEGGVKILWKNLG